MQSQQLAGIPIFVNRETQRTIILRPVDVFTATVVCFGRGDGTGAGIVQVELHESPAYLRTIPGMARVPETA
jgi:hypothetical protein